MQRFTLLLIPVLLLILSSCGLYERVTSSLQAIPEGAVTSCKDAKNSDKWVGFEGRAYYCENTKVKTVKVCRDSNFPLVMPIDPETKLPFPSCTNGVIVSTDTTLRNYCPKSQSDSWSEGVDSEGNKVALRCQYYSGNLYAFVEEKRCFDKDFPLSFLTNSRGKNVPVCTNGEALSLDTDAKNFCAESEVNKWKYVFDKDGIKSAAKCDRESSGLNYYSDAKTCYNQDYPIKITEDTSGQNFATCTDGVKVSEDTNLPNFCSSADVQRWIPTIDSEGRPSASLCSSSWGNIYKLDTPSFSCPSDEYALEIIEDAGVRSFPVCTKGGKRFLDTSAWANFCSKTDINKWLEYYDKNGTRLAMYCGSSQKLQYPKYCRDQSHPLVIKESGGRTYPVCTDGKELSLDSSEANYCDNSDVDRWQYTIDEAGNRSAMRCNSGLYYTDKKVCNDARFPIVIIEGQDGRNFPVCSDGRKFSSHTNLTNYCDRSASDSWLPGVDENGVDIAARCNSGYLTDIKYCWDSRYPLQFIKDDSKDIAQCSNGSQLSLNSNQSNRCKKIEAGKWTFAVEKSGRKVAVECKSYGEYGQPKFCSDSQAQITIESRADGTNFPVCKRGEVVSADTNMDNECSQLQMRSWIKAKDRFGREVAYYCDSYLQLSSKFSCEGAYGDSKLLMVSEDGKQFPRCMNGKYVARISSSNSANRCTEAEKNSWLYMKDKDGRAIAGYCQYGEIGSIVRCENPNFSPSIFGTGRGAFVTCTDGRNFSEEISNESPRCPASLSDQCLSGFDKEGDPTARLCRSDGYLGDKCSNPNQTINYRDYEVGGWTPGIVPDVNYKTAPEPRPQSDFVPDSFAESINFLIDPANPSQFDLKSDVLDAKRVAAIRGKVLDSEGNPLPQAKIRLLGESSFGYTTTVSDGSYSMVTNGGKTYVVDVSLPGYLGAQRSVDVPWNGWAFADDIVLLKKAPSQPIDLSKNSIVSAPKVEDADGAREISVIAAAGTVATVTDASGNSRTLTSLNISATEYTAGVNGRKSMPANLPDASGFTYAVEIQADEAAQGSVTLNKPIYTYVTNFLDFPVGSSVPVGTYDSAKGEWIPEENGSVVAIVGQERGLAKVDLNGDGVAETSAVLNQFGFTDAELGKLGEKYGRTPVSLWRVPLSSFGTKDFNWPYTLPDGATGPDGRIYGGDSEEDNPCTETGSVIDCHNQTFTESFPIDGSPFSLVYASNLAKSRKHSRWLKFPLLGGSVHPRLKSVKVTVAHSGVYREWEFAPSPNLSHEFEWDGKDAWGRTVGRPDKADVTISYEYFADYVIPQNELKRAFGKLPVTEGARLEIVPGRSLLTKALSVRKAIILGPPELDQRKSFGGLALDVDSQIDLRNDKLVEGDGSTRVISGQITWRSPEGGNADRPIYYPFQTYDLRGPKSLLFDSEGNLILADTLGHRILKKQPDGTISVLAGTGAAGFSGDGGPAFAAAFNVIEAIAINPKTQDLVLVDLGNDRIRAIDRNGVVRTIAGNGSSSCVNAAALPLKGTEVPFTEIRGVSVSREGTIFIADSGCNRVYQLSTDGYISVFAGNGVKSLSGDGGAAVNASLSQPDSLAVDINGYVYISEVGNHVIRVVRSDGRIFRVAGTGLSGSSGDGTEATLATFSSPNGLQFDSRGNLYIADVANNNIRVIDLDGKIRTILGKDSQNNIVGTELRYPHGIAFDQTGSIFVAEQDNRRVTAKAIYTNANASGGKEAILLSSDGDIISHYGSDGKILSYYDSRIGFRLLDFRYDREARLESVVDSDNLEYRFAYNSNGQVDTITGPYGHQTSFDYDARGRLDRIVDSQGRSQTLTYHAGTDLLHEIFLDKDLLHKSFHYDDLGNLFKDVGFDGNSKTIVKEYQSDQSGYMVRVTDSAGYVTSYEDVLGVRRRVDPDGFTVESSFDDKAQVYSSVSSDGVTTEFKVEKDRFSRDLTVSKLVTSVRKRDKSGTDKSTSISYKRTYVQGDPTLGIATEEIDLSSTDGIGLKTVFDRATRTLRRIESSGHVSDTIFDERGRIASFSESGSLPLVYEYYPNGKLFRFSQGIRSKEFSYNEKGDIKSIKYPDNTTETFEYDYQANKFTVIPASGVRIEREYDSIDRLRQLKFDSAAHVFDYHPDGSFKSWTMPSLVDQEHKVQWTWDEGYLSRVLDEGYREWVFGFKDGKIKSLVTPDNTYSYSYEPDSKLLDKVTSPALTLDYNYAADKLSSEVISGSSQSTVGYRYKQDETPSSISVNGTAFPLNYESGLPKSIGPISFDWERGILKSIDVGSVSKTLKFNDYGEIESLSYTGLSNGPLTFGYKYYRSGLIEKKNITKGTQAADQVFKYDLEGQLEEVHGEAGLIAAYSYDKRGNRSARGPPANDYDLQDRLLEDQNYTYAYDQIGQIKSRTKKGSGEITGYTYDSFGHLTSVDTAQGNKVSYTVDINGRRLLKSVNGKASFGLVYDGRLKPIAQTDGSGNVTAVFVYGSSPITPDAIVKDGRTYAIVSDHQGTPYFVVDTETGETVQEQTWSAFGELLSDSNPGFQPFGFSGGIYDHDTRLLVYGARSYDPAIGRWISKDPSGLSGGLNLYRYSNNDPVNFIDPEGEIPAFVVPILYAAARGALRGAAEDFVFQMFENGGNFDCIDWQRLGISALEGAVTGGFNGSKLSKIRHIDKPKPYSSPKSRPKYGKNQVEDVWSSARQPDGKVYDPNTGELLTWDKAKPRASQWDMGHKPGHEYRKLHKDYMDGKISKDEFIKRYRDSRNYQPESPSANRSHRYEDI